MSQINTKEGNWLSVVLAVIIAFSFTPWAEPTFPWVLGFVVAFSVFGVAKCLWLAFTTPDRPLSPLEQHVAAHYAKHPDTTPGEEESVIRQYHRERESSWGWR